jgi:protein-disulfide isomerase
METKNKYLDSKIISYLLITLGWFFSGFLIYRTTHLQPGTSAIPDFCQMLFGNSCDKALTTKLSVRFGYSLASMGLVYFGLIGLLLSLNRSFIDRMLVLLAAFGVGVSIFQTNTIIGAHVSCSFCLSIHAINLLLFMSLIKNVQTTKISQVQTTLNRFRPILLRGSILLATIVLGGVSDYYALKATVNKKEPVDLAEVSKIFQSTTQFAIPKSATSPIIGSPDAPIQLIVFSSFQCPACKVFASTLDNIHKKFGDKVGISFKHFPLSTTCNPRISENMQPQACDAALAAVAAQRQNNFWNFHNLLFQSNLEADEKTLVEAAKNSGLDMAKWSTDKQSEAAKISVAEDVNIAYQLGINATPTVFLNGRMVSSFDESVLKVLIQNELNKGL